MDPDPPVPEPASVRPRPALLAGEFAREFERGAASWYGPSFHGRLTASGERFDMHGFTAAHRTLPFGTVVRVHSLVNGRAVDLRITDRGPFSRNRIIDVSRAAAAELGMLGLGFKEVVVLVPESIPALAASPATTKRPRTVKRRPRAR
jgi:rare lipoprotein A